MFPGPDSMGIVWGGVGRALMQFMLFLSHFCYVGGVCALGDPVVPTVRGASRDAVTVYYMPIGMRKDAFCSSTIDVSET